MKSQIASIQHIDRDAWAAPSASNAAILALPSMICQIAVDTEGQEATMAAMRAAIEATLDPCVCRIILSYSQDETGPIVTGATDWPADPTDPLLQCMETQTPLIISDIVANPAHFPHAGRALMGRWRAFSAIPFQAGRMKGAVAIYRHSAHAEHQNDAATLASLAPAVTLALITKSASAPTRNFDALNTLSKAIPGVVYQRCVSPDGKIHYTYISESARTFFGVEPEKILHDPQALFQHYDPDYRASFREKLLQASRDMSIWDVEATIRLPGGGIRSTHAMARPERQQDGSVLWTGVILDASRIKAAERAASEAEARTRSNIVESLSQAFLLFDANDRLVVANSFFHSLYPELSQVVLPGCSYFDFAEAEFELACLETADGAPNVATPEERMRRRVEGRQVSERRCNDDRWVMVTEHRTEDKCTVVLYADVTELKRRENRIHHLAYHDSLTGLPNRSTFRLRLDQAIKQAARLDQCVTVMCLDIDRFKFVNDTLGHPAGDELLLQVASRLRSVLQQNDTAARLGGDEFAIIIESSDPAYPTDLAWRVLATISKPFQLCDNSIVVTTSIGIATVEGGKINNTDTLIKRADLALYRAKADGRDTFRYFEEEMDEAAQERRLLEIDLRLAVERNQLVLYYQPLVDAASEQILGMEALVRWQHPERGLVPPLEFIMIAEESGLIAKIGEWVLRRACFDAASWPMPIRVAVNLSPAQFRDLHFADTVRQCLIDSHLEPRRLELEVTESLLLRETAENLNILTQIKKLGVRIAMDDFGTGYSSLANLRSFPFDKIKIDRSFVQDLNGREDSGAIVRAVLGLARGLGMTTTAEGVETSDQFAYLRAQGCSEVQGFLFSKPRPGKDVVKLLSANTLKLKQLARLALLAGDGEIASEEPEKDC